MRDAPRRYRRLPHPPRPYDLELLEACLTAGGKIKSRSQTGLSLRQQRQVARAIKQARELALLPYARTGGGDSDGRRRPARAGR